MFVIQVETDISSYRDRIRSSLRALYHEALPNKGVNRTSNSTQHDGEHQVAGNAAHNAEETDGRATAPANYSKTVAERAESYKFKYSVAFLKAYKACIPHILRT